MTEERYELLWLATTSNTKTGAVPTAYIGHTIEEVRDSCEGCALLDNGCYAWGGFSRVAMMRHEVRNQDDPERFKLQTMLHRIDKNAKFARIGAMGDPAHAKRDSLRRDIATLREFGLHVISYTHFWFEDYAQDLKDICMASCNTRAEAEVALQMGWNPTLVLPWDHDLIEGNSFNLQDGTPEGALGIVCPAQLKEWVTCNSCLLCRVDHPVWKKGKLRAIGFVDHSKTALADRRRFMRGVRRKQLPLFNPDPYARKTCAQCGAKIEQDRLKDPVVYCSEKCKLIAVGE